MHCSGLAMSAIRWEHLSLRGRALSAEQSWACYDKRKTLWNGYYQSVIGDRRQ